MKIKHKFLSSVVYQGPWRSFEMTDKFQKFQSNIIFWTAFI